MNATIALSRNRRTGSMSSAETLATPIVFVVDDDVSVREALELKSL